MELSLKNSLNNKIVVGTNANGEPITFNIAYPTLKQFEEIERLKWEMVEDGKVNSSAMLKYMRRVIAYSIKDWQGMEEPIRIENGQLCEEQLIKLTIKDENTIGIFNLINNEIGFSETDKKK